MIIRSTKFAQRTASYSFKFLEFSKMKKIQLIYFGFYQLISHFFLLAVKVPPSGSNRGPRSKLTMMQGNPLPPSVSGNPLTLANRVLTEAFYRSKIYFRFLSEFVLCSGCVRDHQSFRML